MAKTHNVLVTGRFWRDQILLNTSASSTAAKRLVMRQTLVRRLAGTACLYSFIKESCHGIKNVNILRPSLPDESDPTGGQRIAQSYWMWSAYPRTPLEDVQVWRLNTGFGYVSNSFRTDYKKLHNFDRPLSELFILVLDDNDFHCTSAAPDDLLGLWPKIGHECPVPENIVLRAGTSLQGTARWKTLSTAYSDRLTIVIPLTALRTWGARISPARSWDCTLAETWHELAHNPLLSSLWACKRIVVHFGAAGAVVFARSAKPICVYDPVHLEGSLEPTWRGDFPGYSSIYTAAVTLSIIRQYEGVLVDLLSRAVGAVRENHRSGGGDVDIEVQESWQHLTDLVVRFLKKDNAQNIYGIHSVTLGMGVPSTPDAANVNLISQLTEDYEYIAHQVVTEGAEKGLSKFPRLRFGQYWSVDREEIERLNTLRTVLHEFARAPASAAPLSIAVFGPPGAGKSFSVKEVSTAVFGKATPFLVFNLSELREEDLPAAFHQIRDERLRGHVPVVFWDEFDTGGLKWLKHFLAPMNDAEFWESGRMHPVGKSVFVFAGSIEASFLGFRELVSNNRQEYPVSLKATDFISRLGGFFDVKGPGVITGTPEDDMSRVRRALLLRSTLEQLYPHLIDFEAGAAHARVDPSVIAGFLGVKRYLHGARSLRAILAMSALRGRQEFSPSMLPPCDQLALHASDDFLEIVRKHPIADSAFH